MRMGAREDQCADVSLLVDDDQRAGAGPLEQPVDVVGPVSSSALKATPPPASSAHALCELFPTSIPR